MDIKYTSLHHIDHTDSSIKEINISGSGEILETYIKRLMQEIAESPHKRRFNFQRESTEVRLAIEKMIQGNYIEGANVNASRLLPIEQEAQKGIAQLQKEIQKGSLFQTIIENEYGTFIIISKADHNEFLDDIDFHLHKGLPWKKKVFKAFMAKIENDGGLSNIDVYDTNASMTKYWWYDYFELREVHTDTHNTQTSLDILDKKIFNPIKSDFPADHLILRNAAIGYFRNKTEYDNEDFLNQIFNDYEPVDNNLPKQKLIEKIKEMPEKWNYDHRFTISKKDINKRAINRIVLATNIELILKDSIDLNLISPFQDDEGHKGIKIISEAGYKNFKR